MPRTGKARTYENTRKAAGQSSIAGKLGTGAAPKLPFDLRKFGTIETPAPPMFPYEAGDGGMPFPVMPDVLGCGEAAIQFLNRFTIPEGRARGLPVGDNLAPFMRAAVLNIFGHRDVATLTRYIRAVMFTAPRKSMKSWLSAIVAILFLYSEQERAGEILITATAQRQSRRIFDLILGTLRTNPELFKQLRVQDMFSTITNTTTATKIVATPANPEKLWGLSPSVILADEAHAWSGEKGQKLWNSLITGQGARSNPLWIISSTCPDDPPAPDDVYAQQLSYALKVQSGAVDDRRYLPMLWVCPSDADIADEDVWRRYNPGLGYSLTLEEIREEFARAKESNGLHGFRAMRLNQIPLSSLDEGWLSPDTIERCCQEAVTLDDIADCGLKAIGLDMGGARDLASIAILGVTDEGQLIARQMSWLSRAGFELIRGRAPLQEFVRRGELTITGDDAVPSEEVASDLIDIAARLGIHEVAVDPAMTALIAPAL